MPFNESLIILKIKRIKPQHNIMKKLFTLGLLLMTLVAFGQKKDFTSEEIKVSTWIDGTLLVH